MMNLMHGDCLDKMREIPAGSVDMVLTDPPYGTVKGAGLDGWDAERTAWDNALEPADIFGESERVLRTNGALALFSQEPYTSRLITQAHGNLPFSYRMVWRKDHFANSLIAKKAPVQYTEDVSVYRKHYETLGEHPLRTYAAKVQDYTGMTKRRMFNDMGHQGACHFLRHDSTQFDLCTERTYNDLIRLYRIDQMPGFIAYAELKKRHQEFKSRFAATFNLPPGKKYKSNVLEYRKDYSGHHPTQKPVALLEDLIETYTNPGDTVLDFTMGSGSTGVACVNTGRRFIGIELDAGYFEIAERRIAGARMASGGVTP